MPDPVKVLVVDDSALVRKMLTDFLNRHPSINVVGTAQDGTFVMSKIESLKPDVITLDVEMRNKGGLEVLPEIAKKYQLPVIMVSAHTERGAESTLKALELGAIDFVTKPQASGMASVQDIVDILSRKIIAVARHHTKPQKNIRPVKDRSHQSTASTLAKPLPSVKAARVDVIAIGASTGGTEAIKDVLVNLPENLPGIVIVQHMPAGFTKAFANRLNNLCRIQVKEAENGDPILPGTALVAPGSHHLEVTRNGAQLKACLLETPPVNRHRPSVDVLFHSVATKIGGKSLGIILTGMGGDGAVGLKEIRDKGALTIAQDEESCVVFGMPREAIKLGGAVQILSLSRIAPFVVKAVMPARQNSVSPLAHTN